MKGKWMGAQRILAGWLGIMTAMGFLLCGSVQAFEIPTGNEDLILRWDNTLKYNSGYRVKSQAADIMNAANFNDGDRNFDKGFVTNRFDLLTEMDLNFKKEYGVRVSGAFWYDQAYSNTPDNNSVLTSNHISNGQQAIGFSDITERYNEGPDGELLDAFAFWRMDFGPVPVNFKLGRHSIYWGESMINNQGISYSQAPLDLAKAISVPGTELKELFRPLAQISASSQLTDKLTLAGQWFLQWEPYRIAESGAYLATFDTLMRGGESLILAPGVFLRHSRDGYPDAQKNFGVAMRWRPDFLPGTVGFYYRKFADMFPSHTILDIPNNRYFVAYADDIDLYGISYAQTIGGISIGMDLSWRHGMSLASEPAILPPGTALKDGDTLGARGNTYHASLNFLQLLPKIAGLWDQADYLVEFSWNGYSSVTSHDEVFKGRDGYDLIDKASKNAFGVVVNFTPKWLQVLPGADLSMPLSYSRGLCGNSPVNSGSNENSGQYSIGLSLDVYSRHTFTLAYIGYYGQTNLENGFNFNDPMALLEDRNWISFTAKTTF